MPVRVVVRERRVVDDLDPGRVAVHEEQRRQGLAVDQRVRHHDVHRGDVAIGHEPLVAPDSPAGVGALGRRLDAGGIGAGVLLGHRVGVVRLAAQPGPQVAVDLLGRAVGEHVVPGRDVPGDRVRRAAELLLDEEPLDVGPALAAVLGAVQAAAEPALQRLLLDARDGLGRQAAVGALGLLLERDQDLVDEGARTRLQLGLGGRQAFGGGGDGGGGHACLISCGDVGWGCGERARTDPGRRRAADRPRGDRRRADRADRDRCGRLLGGRPLPLRVARGPARGGARALLRARRRHAHAHGRGRSRVGAGASAADDRSVPAGAGFAARRLHPVDGALAARRTASRAAGDERPALRAHARVVRRGAGGGGGGRRVRGARPGPRAGPDPRALRRLRDPRAVRGPGDAARARAGRGLGGRRAAARRRSRRPATEPRVIAPAPRARRRSGCAAAASWGRRRRASRRRARRGRPRRW